MRSRIAPTSCLAWRRLGTVISLTMNRLFEPSSTLSVHENQVRGMSITTYSKCDDTRSSSRVTTSGSSERISAGRFGAAIDRKPGRMMRQHDSREAAGRGAPAAARSRSRSRRGSRSR